MRIFPLICLAIIPVSTVSAQTPSGPMFKLPEDPAGMLSTALPLYDFGGATMKPWHIKGTYQLYDESWCSSTTRKLRVLARIAERISVQLEPN